MKFRKKAVKAIALAISGVILYRAAHKNIPVREQEIMHGDLSNFATTRTRNSNTRSLTINLGGGNCKWQVSSNFKMLLLSRIRGRFNSRVVLILFTSLISCLLCCCVSLRPMRFPRISISIKQWLWGFPVEIKE